MGFHAITFKLNAKSRLWLNEHIQLCGIINTSSLISQFHGKLVIKLLIIFRLFLKWKLIKILLGTGKCLSHFVKFLDDKGNLKMFVDTKIILSEHIERMNENNFFDIFSCASWIPLKLTIYLVHFVYHLFRIKQRYAYTYSKSLTQ